MFYRVAAGGRYVRPGSAGLGRVSADRGRYAPVGNRNPASRITKLNADRERKPPKTLGEALTELKVEPMIRGGATHIGNATDWNEYRLSPGYVPSAGYTQGAAKETAFRGVRIIKAERAKNK